MLILDLHTGNNLQDLCNYETVLETSGCFGHLRYLEFAMGNSILGKNDKGNQKPIQHDYWHFNNKFVLMNQDNPTILFNSRSVEHTTNISNESIILN